MIERGNQMKANAICPPVIAQIIVSIDLGSFFSIGINWVDIIYGYLKLLFYCLLVWGVGWPFIAGNIVIATDCPESRHFTSYRRLAAVFRHSVVSAQYDICFSINTYLTDFTSSIF
jgi:hypothetical protein